MPSQRDAGDSTAGSVPESMVRAQLEGILASDTFSRSERLSRFLRFIVEQTLDGQAACLKEQVLASELYGRSTDFEAATDPVVRVDARRLRDKLREYYAEFPEEPVLIALPRGGYIPSFHRNSRVPVAPLVQVTDASEPNETRTRPRSRRVQAWSAAAAAAIITLIGVVLWLAVPETQRDSHKLVPLTCWRR